MNFRVTAMMLCGFLLVSPAWARYWTYVQVNRVAGDKQKSSVLVLVGNGDFGGKPKKGDDAAISHVTLANHERQTTTFRNKDFPERKYVIDVNRKDQIVDVKVLITEKGRELFQADEHFACW